MVERAAQSFRLRVFFELGHDQLQSEPLCFCCDALVGRATLLIGQKGDGNLQSLMGNRPSLTCQQRCGGVGLTITNNTGLTLDSSFGTGGIDYNYLSNNEIAVQFIPEPSTALLAILGGFGLFLRRRRA